VLLLTIEPGDGHNGSCATDYRAEFAASSLLSTELAFLSEHKG
jgi:hypothetical protein